MGLERWRDLGCRMIGWSCHSIRSGKERSDWSRSGHVTSGRPRSRPSPSRQASSRPNSWALFRSFCTSKYQRKLRLPVSSGSGCVRELRLTEKYIDHCLDARTEPGNAFRDNGTWISARALLGKHCRKLRASKLVAQLQNREANRAVRWRNVVVSRFFVYVSQKKFTVCLIDSPNKMHYLVRRPT